MLFDTHAHMDADSFDPDRRELLAALPGQGVGLVMNPGCSYASSLAAIALAETYDFIYAAVGSHPDVADEVDDALIAKYRMLCKQHPRVKAIGEIGLDYHYEDIPRDIQQHAFRLQMELARELQLPVIVHEREAHEDGLRIVDEFPTVTGVFHCYSGSLEMAKELIKRGWYIGFTGVLTFKNARKAIEVASAIPLDRIVIETDCPYMAPDPFRGKRNDPGKLYRMAEKLAELRGISVEEARRITTENGKRLYRIS
ncbi:MAG: TatD family deoxyribonuclease [Ruminococcaceae bacterium]|nr:TatD family deoxyribonuclease [Oscillospiraceae bacterium]